MVNTFFYYTHIIEIPTNKGVNSYWHKIWKIGNRPGIDIGIILSGLKLIQNTLSRFFLPGMLKAESIVYL